MANNSPDSVHRFRLKPTKLLQDGLITLFFWLCFGIPLVILSIETIAFWRAENPDFFIRSIRPMMLLLVAMMSFVFLQINLSFVLEFFSYVKLTADAIEQRRSMFRYARITWDEVEKIEKYFLFFEVLVAKPKLSSSRSSQTAIPFGLLWPKQPFIILNGYEGWPDGELRAQLGKYAPQLFQNSSEEHSA